MDGRNSCRSWRFGDITCSCVPLFQHSTSALALDIASFQGHLHRMTALPCMWISRVEWGQGDVMPSTKIYKVGLIDSPFLHLTQSAPST